MFFQIKNQEESNQKIKELSLKALIAELPNLIALLTSALISNSIIIWVDCLGSLSFVLHSLIIFLVIRRIEEDETYRFDVPRLEVMTSFISDLLIVGSYLTLFICAVYDTFHPSAANNWILLYFLVKIIDILFDLYFYHKQKSLLLKHPSKINETETVSWKNNLLIDVLVGAISVIAYLLVQYEWSWRISPIATLIISLFFITDCCKRINETFNELIDSAVSVPQQDEIVDLLLEHRPGCLERIEKIRIFNLNCRLNIVLGIVFKKETTFQEQTMALKKWKDMLKEKYPECIICVEIID